MKFLTPAILTVVMLVVVGFLVLAYVAKSVWADAEPEPAEPRVVVPMAISDLEPGTLVTDAHLADGPALRSSLRRTSARADSVILGRVVKNKISAAEPIDTTDLYQPGEQPPLDLAPGMRAMTVSFPGGAPVVNGLLKPGQHADIYFVPEYQRGDRYRGARSVQLYSGVHILAINRRTQGGAVDERVNNVTLEVTPEQANILNLAQNRGSLSLTYTPDGRGSDELAVEGEELTYLEEALGLRPIPEPPAPFAIETYSGGDYSLQQFRNGTRVNADPSGAFAPATTPVSVDADDEPTPAVEPKTDVDVDIKPRKDAPEPTRIRPLVPQYAPLPTT